MIILNHGLSHSLEYLNSEWLRINYNIVQLYQEFKDLLSMTSRIPDFAPVQAKVDEIGASFSKIHDIKVWRTAVPKDYVPILSSLLNRSAATGMSYSLVDPNFAILTYRGV